MTRVYYTESVPGTEISLSVPERGCCKTAPAGNVEPKQDPERLTTDQRKDRIRAILEAEPWAVHGRDPKTQARDAAKARHASKWRRTA